MKNIIEELFNGTHSILNEHSTEERKQILQQVVKQLEKERDEKQHEQMV